MSKRYLEQNVYDAARERLHFTFDNFERIYVAFSGGKDSGVLLNLALDYMRENGITRKLGVLFVDMEAQYTATIDYIRQEFEQHADLIEPYWVCLPINLRNAVSVFEPFWTPWDKAHRDKWIRELPEGAITEDSHPFPFFRREMEFEEFVPAFGDWYAQGGRAAALVGIRSDESLNRWRTIASKAKTRFKGKPWTTEVSPNLVNVYPIYDWSTEDIWTANAKHGWSYNRLYDSFYMAGVGIHDQRICQPYGDDQRIGLNLFRVVEPHTWAKVVNRVSGANFGNIYCGERVLGYRGVKLPPGHTWKSYTKLLLATLPPATRDHYVDRFKKFMRYWSRVGSPVPHEVEDMLPPEAKRTGRPSTRSKTGKHTVIYKRIPDALDVKLESSKAGPSWRRMAICILKNDHLCKTLSFTQTKEQRARIQATLEKYKCL